MFATDDETSRKGFKVEIKPVANGNPPISASVDELQRAVGGLGLVPPPLVSFYGVFFTMSHTIAAPHLRWISQCTIAVFFLNRFFLPP